MAAVAVDGRCWAAGLLGVCVRVCPGGNCCAEVVGVRRHGDASDPFVRTHWSDT